MLKSLRFPLIYLLEFALWIPVLASFSAMTLFTASDRIENLDLKGRALPASWEAAIFNHGRYIEGYLIDRHPILFVLIVLALLSSVALLFLVHKAELWQQSNLNESELTRHKAARFVVMACVAALVYFVLFGCLHDVAPV